ncbi:hypothetical protein MTR_3g073400 [Medicago truncatula]|uniref:Uncharacterized protein n=1 Tax=Medicago truncatula TaxID=3880 RepID=G7J461_MEDTR|nr:hypothetical protein MTR_3g073400 [Medicago truncatula]
MCSNYFHNVIMNNVVQVAYVQPFDEVMEKKVLTNLHSVIDRDKMDPRTWRSAHGAQAP